MVFTVGEGSLTTATELGNDGDLRVCTSHGDRVLNAISLGRGEVIVGIDQGTARVFHVVVQANGELSA
jgi:hypothetical protein